MTDFEIVFIVLMTVFCGLLLVLYLFLSENYKSLNNTMLKHLSLNRELVSILREEAEEDDEVEENQPQDDDPDPRHKKLSQDDLDHWKQVYDYQMETLKATPITKEAIDKVLKREHHFIYVGDEVVETTIKECIDLLSTDGKGTKQQVKQKLEELLK